MTILFDHMSFYITGYLMDPNTSTEATLIHTHTLRESKIAMENPQKNKV